MRQVAAPTFRGIEVENCRFSFGSHVGRCWIGSSPERNKGTGKEELEGRENRNHPGRWQRIGRGGTE